MGGAEFPPCCYLGPNYGGGWETCMQFGNQELELDMEQQTGSK